MPPPGLRDWHRPDDSFDVAHRLAGSVGPGIDPALTNTTPAPAVLASTSSVPNCVLHDARDTALLRVLRGGGSTSVADRHAVYTAYHHPDVHSLCVEATDTDGATRSFCLEHVGAPATASAITATPFKTVYLTKKRTASERAAQPSPTSSPTCSRGTATPTRALLTSSPASASRAPTPTPSRSRWTRTPTP